jgi:hypothetical protein
MSLVQLQQQIKVATLAMAKAEESGTSKNKAALREELSQFANVLEKSKARLRELESIKQQCDDLSACRDAPERNPITEISVTRKMAKMHLSPDDEVTQPTSEITVKQGSNKEKETLDDDDSYYKPIVIPWLEQKKDNTIEETKRQLKELSNSLDQQDVPEGRDEEEGSVVSILFIF